MSDAFHRPEPVNPVDAILAERLNFAVHLESLTEKAQEHLPSWTSASLIGAAKAPLLVVLGGISGDSNVAYRRDGRPGWWHSLFGFGAPLGIDRYRILGIDFIADEQGRYAPTSHEQASILADTLSAIKEKPLAIIGASYGGMVALAYAERFHANTKLVILSASAQPHPMATAQRSLQRQLLKLGMENGCAPDALSIARGMAMLTYRTRREFGERFAGGIKGEDPCAPSEPLVYLDARGRAYADVTPPGRFLSLSASIDRHSITPENIEAPALVIGVEEDQLVPLEDVAALAARLGGPTRFRAIRSLYGHDAFLKEPAILGRIIEEFLEATQDGAEVRTADTRA